MQKKILVVDDERSLALMLAEFIGILGGESKILTGGRDVVSTVKNWKPDLVTLDIMMPDPDGFQILHQLKTDPETKNTPVFVVSVLAGEPEYLQRLAMAEQSFAKPADMQKLARNLESLIKSEGKEYGLN